MYAKNDEPQNFTAGAALRIFGAGLDIDDITREFGYTPDHRHKAGDPDPGKRPYPHDIWSLASPLGEDRDLEAHLSWLAEKFLHHGQYLHSLRQRFQVDIYCWKHCFTEQASLTLSPQALRIFTELSTPFCVSLIFLPEENDNVLIP
jgi:hypothetical protein